MPTFKNGYIKTGAAPLKKQTNKFKPLFFIIFILITLTIHPAGVQQ
jgi:hypothetical protein